MKGLFGNLGAKALAVGLLAAGGMAASASTASAQAVEFRGGGYVSFSSQCEVEGWIGTTYVNSRYRHPNVGSNGPTTNFSMYFPLFYATNYVLPRGNLTAAFKPVRGGGLGNTTWVQTGKQRMRVTLRSPSTITTSTEAVRLQGQIRGFDNMPNCLVDFDVSMTRRP